MRTIDYDRLKVWGPWFTEIMSEAFGTALIDAASRTHPEYVSDAREFFEREIGLQELVKRLNGALDAYAVRVYHGTRLSEEEMKSLRRHGLRPLTVKDRKDILVPLLSRHPDWEKQKHRLDEVLYRFGAGWAAGGGGRREDGCIHVCLSRAGLLRSANHYLTHGAEVDQHVVKALFGNEHAVELLRHGRIPRLIAFTSPFADAAMAANPWGVRQDEMPALLRRFFAAWAFSLSHKRFTVTSQRDSAALRFPGPITADRFVSVRDISDRMLDVRP